MGRSRKKQTRLAFNPLPSSSPAAKGYNKQIQDRAAIVTYDGASDSLSAWRKPRNAPEKSAVNEDLPTPGATFESTAHRTSDDSDSDSEPVRSSQRQFTSSGAAAFTSGNASSSRAKHPRQQPLDFSRVRDADSFDPPVALPSSSIPQQPSSTMFSSQVRKRRMVDVSSDDDDSDALPELEQAVKKSKKEKKKDKKKQMKEREKRQTRSSQEAIAIEEDDEEDIVVASSSRAPITVNDSEDDDEMPTTLGKQSRKRRAPASSPPFSVDTDDDDDVIVVSPQKKRRRQTHSQSDDEDDAPITPGRRKLKKKRQLTQQEQEDINDDLDFLGPSSDVESSARRPRDSQSVKKNARLQALERLKRKRAGHGEQLEPVVEDDEEEDGAGGDDGEEGSEDGILGYEDNGEYEGDDTPQITSSRQLFAPTQDDEDFIEQDDDEAPGSATRTAIPIQFTKYATMSAKQLFKYAIDWMVQKKINPAFQLHDELYTLTFKKLDDEVQGLAGSKFRSAAWTPDFTLALQARPEIVYDQFQAFSEWDENGGGGHCDACNRSGHPATYRVQFEGKPYNAQTLEEIENPDDCSSDADSSSSSPDDDEEDEDDHQVDSLGRAIPPSSKEYLVGRFCMANARTAHALQHWRWSLYSWVETWLDRNGYNAQDKIVERDRMKEKKRRRLANKIADRMGEEGVVKQLWRDFRSNIDEARNSKQGRFAAGDSP